METFAITGATGQVGKELALILQRDNIPNRLLVRNPEKAKPLSHPSTTIVHFDFNRKDTYELALEGSDRLFLVCSSLNEDALRTFLKVASATGIKQVVFMSGLGIDVKKNNSQARLHHLVEGSGIPFVALRANWFIQNFGSMFKGMVMNQHELTFPDGGAPLSFVDARDIAEVAKHFLTSDRIEREVLLDITGPESLSHAEVAELFTKHLPYEVGYRQISESDAREKLGWDDGWIDLFRDIRNGLTSPVSDNVQNILRKPPRQFEDYIAENKSLWLD